MQENRRTLHKREWLHQGSHSLQDLSKAAHENMFWSSVVYKIVVSWKGIELTINTNIESLEEQGHPVSEFF